MPLHLLLCQMHCECTLMHLNVVVPSLCDTPSTVLPFPPSPLQLLADVYIFTDHMTGQQAGASPGYGVTLVAETTSGRLLAAEACAAVPGEVGGAGEGTGGRGGGNRQQRQLCQGDRQGMKWAGSSQRLGRQLHCISCALAVL